MHTRQQAICIKTVAFLNISLTITVGTLVYLIDEYIKKQGKKNNGNIHSFVGTFI